MSENDAQEREVRCIHLLLLIEMSYVDSQVKQWFHSQAKGNSIECLSKMG